MQEKPRVGLVLMRWSWDGCAIGRQAQQDIDVDAGVIVERLSSIFSITGPLIVDSPASLAACREQLEGEPLDMVLVTFQTWIDENLLVSLVQPALHLPLVLWCFLPFRRFPSRAKFHEVLRSTGSVSAFSALGVLRNLQAPFLFTWGAVDDPRLIKDLVVAGRAAKARAALARARFGLLPSRNPSMHTSLASETRLKQDFGTQVEVISLEAYRQELDAITPEDMQRAVDHLRQYEIAREAVGELETGARLSLGLARLAERYRLDVLALNGFPPELEDEVKIRPALYPEMGSSVQPEVCPLYQSEADLGAAAANFILSRLTGSPTMFVEFWYWNEAMNQLVGGHPGLQNPALAAPGQVWISRDYMICSKFDRLGVQFEMIARSGRVTIFQMRATPDGWQAIAASGMALESLPVVEGVPHMLFRLDAPIDHFLNQLVGAGAGQHWIMAYGSVLHELEAFCQMENIPLLLLRN